MDIEVTVTVPREHGRPDGWLPLLASLAAADALREAAALPAEVGWPGDVLIPGAMCGGSAGSKQIGHARVEPAEDGSTITITIAVTAVPDAVTTSVASAGGRTDSEAIRLALDAHLHRRLAQWQTGDPALPADYRARCQTIGRLADGAHWYSGVADDGTLDLTELTAPVTP